MSEYYYNFETLPTPLQNFDMTEIVEKISYHLRQTTKKSIKYQHTEKNTQVFKKT